MSSHIRKGVEFVCDPRILENQRKILQYIRNFQEEQNRIRQDVHMIMKESKHFQRTIHENVRVLNDNINSVLDYVEDLNECTDHMKDRLKSVYKYVKQMSSHQEALSSDTDSNIRPRRQPGRPTRAKLKPSGEVVLTLYQTTRFRLSQAERVLQTTIFNLVKMTKSSSNW